MKKRFSFLIALMLLCALFPVSRAETVKLTFWHSMSEGAGTLIDGYVKQFNETVGKKQGIEVEAVFQGQYAEAVSKMKNILFGKQYDVLPDVMQLDATGKVPYAAAETAYPIGAALQDHPDADLSVFLAPAMANWQLAGEQLGLPFATSTTVLYYNKTALEAAGFDAPKTLDDIGALSSLAADGVAVYASIPNTPLLANWLGQLGSDLVNRHNGTEGSATELACVENGALASFLTAWKNLYATGALVNQNSSGDEFAAGRQLLMTESTSKVASILKKIDGRFELGIAPYPQVSADSAAGATVSGSCLVMFDHGDERKNAAWTFLQYLTGAEIQADFAAKTGYLPANKGAAESEVWQALIREYPQYQVGLSQLAVTPDTMRSVTVGPAADFYYAIINDISDMLDQNLTAEETVELMVGDLGGMLEQYALANP
ncbi:MAG: extracellular solute-binding protein [Clostridia bacterium]|nr:extracellular solute-binding protein [Clostridia bacterium]